MLVLLRGSDFLELFDLLSAILFSERVLLSFLVFFSFPFKVIVGHFGGFKTLRVPVRFSVNGSNAQM